MAALVIRQKTAIENLHVSVARLTVGGLALTQLVDSLPTLLLPGRVNLFDDLALVGPFPDSESSKQVAFVREQAANHVIETFSGAPSLSKAFVVLERNPDVFVGSVAHRAQFTFA